MKFQRPLSSLLLFMIVSFLNIDVLHSAAYPLIEEIVVTRDTIKVVPNQHFQQSYLYPKNHTITYLDPAIDLREYDNSIHIMPFIFDILPLIFLSGDVYVVDCLDSEMCKSLEHLRLIFKEMFPKTQWEGKLVCKEEKIHHFQFQTQKTMTLFSGGIDSTFSLLRNRDKEQILFTLKGHIDSSTQNQWEETEAILHQVCKRFNYKSVIGASKGSYLVNRKLAESHTGDLYDWSSQALGDLRWVGKAIPLMIFYEASTLCIPSTISWSYPFVHLSNPIVDDGIRFGNCLSVYTDGFDHSRTQKTHYITTSLTSLLSPDESWPLKVCFAANGKNCGHCLKCMKTMNDLFLSGVDPNNYGFVTTLEQAKEFLIASLEIIRHETAAHREIYLFSLNEQLKFIEDNGLYGKSDYATWLYDTLINNPFIIDIRQRPSEYYLDLKTALKNSREES